MVSTETDAHHAFMLALAKGRLAESKKVILKTANAVQLA
jgi:hypothetical protein